MTWPSQVEVASPDALRNEGVTGISLGALAVPLVRRIAT